MQISALPSKPPRNYLSESFKVDNWESIQPFFDALLKQTIHSLEDLEQWILNRNELEAVLMEESRWRYIRLSCNNKDAKIKEAFNFFLNEIAPKVSYYNHLLNKKMVNSPLCQDLEKDKYFIYLRALVNEIKLYREENIELLTKIQIKTKEFGGIASEMTIELNGETYTIPQAQVLLSDQDRTLRKRIYLAISNRRLEEAEKLNTLFDDLLNKRQQLAENAGYKNYRDYKFRSLGRFDYKISDCFDFHDAIAAEVVPIMNSFYVQRKKDLEIEKLRPWDLAVDPQNLPSIKPSKNVEELIEKSVACLSKVHPYFGQCIEIMNQMNHLDLESRVGKRPGGYNMSLPETGVPFIFMNSANSLKDMRTMMHESGHAVHSFLTKDRKLNSEKRPPSEVAELAAMAMELLSMDYWDTFFEDKEELRRAKLWQLKRSINILPWVATIDKFQHWLYTNEGHTLDEREAAWMKINMEFEAESMDWEGCEFIQKKLWQRQLHIFEVPFYYIEYGIAQLGAIAIWRNYRENPELAIQNYMKALQLGYSCAIGEIYETAGIKFDFSRAYVKELMDFMQIEIERLQA